MSRPTGRGIRGPTAPIGVPRSEHAFDAFARQAADAISRRGSLRTLGAAALAAGLVAPAAIRAK
jgi:hypothetical protein